MYICVVISWIETSASPAAEQFRRVYGLLPEGQGQNLALTVLYVPYSLDSGRAVGSLPFFFMTPKPSVE